MVMIGSCEVVGELNKSLAEKNFAEFILAVLLAQEEFAEFIYAIRSFGKNLVEFICAIDFY